MTTVLQIENLSKEYRLGVFGHGSLCRDIQSWWARRRGREDPNAQVGVCVNGREAYGNRIWALQDVSLKIGQGEVLGIIGRNGAGKSTLLKIISRVTAPTKGQVKIRGRVASLLEVGTGFHPDLTGRENTFLNGAILGMTVAEINRKFDEIVAFSGVEEFIDTPVKRYSSGMYVRLAFAVAAHLDLEILVVDEILAVGDAEFQKKCLGKMGNVAKEGRTILFVSHNLQAMRRFCTRGVLFDNGSLTFEGDMDVTLDAYMRSLKGVQVDASSELHNPAYRRGSGAIRFTGITILDEVGDEKSNFEMGETIRFKCSYKVFKDLPGLSISVLLRSGLTGEAVTSADHEICQGSVPAGTQGTVWVEFPNSYIRPGEYPLYFWIGYHRPPAVDYDVVDGVTAPLIITGGQKSSDANFDPVNPVGYFSIPSRAYIGN